MTFHRKTSIATLLLLSLCHAGAGASVPARAAVAPLALAPVDVQTSPTLRRIAQGGVIRVGYIPTPGTFAFQDAGGDTVGYSIDICRQVIANVRRALGKAELRVVWRAVKPSERIPFLKSGEIDIECGGNTNTTARQKDVDFSHTFFVTGARLLTHKSVKADRPADLWKKTIAVSRGTTAEALVNQLRQEQGVTVVVVGTDPEGLKLVEDKKADAFAQDDILLYGLMAGSAQRDELTVTGKFMSVEPYAFMLPKDDLRFRQIVDDTTASLMRSGELVVLYRKWFDTGTLRIPMSHYLKENIRFPNKYGIP
jgi:glutamate/aspartate transport system substrate-binding protein